MWNVGAIVSTVVTSFVSCREILYRPKLGVVLSVVIAVRARACVCVCVCVFVCVCVCVLAAGCSDRKSVV
jgi:hypothetical protein